MNIYKLLISSLKKHNMTTFDNQFISLLTTYISLLINCNKKINLTSDNNIDIIINKHIIDSLQLLKLPFVSQCETLLDIGTGAGFPGIILGIFLNKKITLIESNNKKVLFLNIVKYKLNLKNISIIQERAEILAHYSDFREKFDCTITRALSNFSNAMELSFPFTKVNGRIIYYATEKTIKFIKEDFDRIRFLGCEQYELFPYYLYNNKFYLFYVQKMWKTPEKYPRAYNKIKNKKL